VILYFRPEVLDADLARLRGLGYSIETIDCRGIDDFRLQLTRSLKFKDQFGYEPWTGNLNALNDALRYLDVPRDSGLAFCFHRYDLLKAANAEFADGVLDLFELNSRDHLLVGCRLIAMVQSDDSAIRVSPLGARSASWNRHEWPNSSRGL
jgi:hypothetical protein